MDNNELKRNAIKKEFKEIVLVAHSDSIPFWCHVERLKSEKGNKRFFIILDNLFLLRKWCRSNGIECDETRKT